ncbi:MAG: bis(5'-nucleosyl)-tetraphosphatase (symmetrical) YqeK [Bacillota bacterium]
MIERIKNDLKQYYKNDVTRLSHIYGVKDTALKLGKLYGADLTKLTLASYLHDITKHYPTKTHIDILKANQKAHIINDFTPPLYHAYTASIIAKEHYNIKDTDILSAIESHTVGKPNMSLLEKILFISDFIEPHRLYPSCVIVREIAFNDLDLAVFKAIDLSITLYEKKHETIPIIAYQALAYYTPKKEINL